MAAPFRKGPGEARGGGAREKPHVTLSGGPRQLLHSPTLPPPRPDAPSSGVPRESRASLRLKRRRAGRPRHSAGGDSAGAARPSLPPARPLPASAPSRSPQAAMQPARPPPPPVGVAAESCVPAGLRLGPVAGAFKLGKYLSDRREPGPKKKVRLPPPGGDRGAANPTAEGEEAGAGGGAGVAAGGSGVWPQKSSRRDDFFCSFCGAPWSARLAGCGLEAKGRGGGRRRERDWLLAVASQGQRARGLVCRCKIGQSPVAPERLTISYVA